MKERNYGIDLLRVVAMCFIIILHLLGHGGVLDSSAPGSINWLTAYFFETLAYSGVGIFATISGYVGYTDARKPHRLRSFFNMWFKVFFYSIVISIL